MPITYTPIRYPGGKSKIYPLVDSIIEASGLVGCAYAEAFCGGAGLAAKLLLKGRVSRIVLNDLDPAVYSMWDCIVNHPDELCGFIEGAELSVAEWERHRKVLLSSDGPSVELGLSAFYLNRTNRSGILRGGPIGGRSQESAYGIGARFNRPALVGKVRALAARAADIELRNMDARDFIDGVLSGMEGVFANFDPPYVVKGPGLYHNAYGEEDHLALAERIGSCSFPWIVTYDAVGLVDEVYGGFDRYTMGIGYSAARAKRGSEILVAGPGVSVPDGALERRGMAA